MKLSNRLAIAFVLFSLFLVVAVSFTFFFIVKDVVEDRVINQLESVVTLKSNQLDGFFFEEGEDLESIAIENIFIDSYILMLEHHSMGHGSEVYEHLFFHDLLDEKINTMGKDFSELFILTNDGEVHISTDDKQIGKIKAQERYFIEGKDKTTIQYFFYDQSLGEITTIISTPIKDHFGNTLGVLAARVDNDKISEIMTERAGLGETGETFLVNNFNYVVTELRFEDEAELRKTFYDEQIKDCLAGNTGSAIHLDYRDQEVISYYTWLDESQSCLNADIDNKEALASVNDIIKLIFIIAIISIVLAIIVGYFYSRTVTNSLERLTDEVESISKGDLSVQLEGSKIFEIQNLVNSLNRVITSLKLAVMKVGISKEELKLGQVLKEKAKVEKELRRAEEFNRDIIMHAGLPILAFYKDDGVLIANDKLFELTGYSKEEIDTKEKWVALAYPSKEIAEKVKNNLKRVIEGKKVKDLVIPIKCKNDKHIIIVTNIAAVKDHNGVIIGEVMFMRDLSEIFSLETKLHYWAASDLFNREHGDMLMELDKTEGVEISGK